MHEAISFMHNLLYKLTLPLNFKCNSPPFFKLKGGLKMTDKTPV